MVEGVGLYSPRGDRPANGPVYVDMTHSTPGSGSTIHISRGEAYSGRGVVGLEWSGRRRDEMLGEPSIDFYMAWRPDLYSLSGGLL